MDAALGRDCVLCLAPAHDLVCADCERELPTAPREGNVVAAFAYAFPVDRLVQRYKTGGDFATGDWLARVLARRVAGEPRPDVVVAPPLARRRLWQRGFNQAAEIARVVARELHVRHASRGLRKVRETPPQQGLGRSARLRNLRGAFACKLALRGRRVAIVDDVVTTGATTHALASVLRRAGARDVVVWAVARAPRRGG